MKKFIGFAILGLIAVVFIGTAVFLYNKSQAKPVVYESDATFKSTIIKKTVAVGKVIPRREVEIKSQVSGVVEQLYVVAGQTVKKGEIIAKITLAPNMIQLNQAESQLEQARINLQNATTEFERQKKLFTQKLVSQSEYNKFLLQYDLQREAVTAAENNVLLLKQGATKKSDKVSNLIPATVTGMVLDLPYKEGAFIVETSSFGAGTTIATLADMNDMIFEGMVDESEVGKIREGMELVLDVGALEGDPFTAKLEYISPKGVTDQGTIKFQIRAAVTLNDRLFLRANYSANADIVLDKRENVLAINEGNLSVEEKGHFVEIETGPQKFEKRAVKTGLSDGINIEIVEGLKEGDKIKRR
ncbi:efflux RND transporter periplasmic adaptor subunit [Cellvibrio japonicus]|uniref:Membrane fusion efflux protein n=1 Tax=Cellvibrio japonicus (strain Ueda107) TaxID=498211 RepID=B3PEQ3_CELJU|nr:efflux RND transporter periplasmic adaptor subunit [Cellvibrio japonicus]ACE84231.1 membrane fusion efflux protein [Cellvibrio japonicus Ueda107]QEI10792.1 efflux RND transporter periplasmic adaptor subunit [Cellvibrio japonicus]QEI14368.1 efflux RND transporter periplasmic adaptor subunit [Cellvibrio japonicus]QEI17946.1 efflux RND transporter periplasmic adaptor subunit [Cellvibrio japonicus]